MKRIFFAGLFTALSLADAGSAHIAAASYIAPLKGAQTLAKLNPTPENHMNLSLNYYSYGLFEECIAAGLDAIKLRPNYAEAYNLIGAAYNNMQMWDKAVTALDKALSLNPGFQLARNNLNHALSQKALSGGSMTSYISPIKAALKVAESNPTPENYLNLSLTYYGAKLFEESAAAAKKSIKLRPNYDLAYNILGVAYNSMQMWDEAIAALEKATRITPNFQLAKNNLEFAKARKAAGWGR